jgi:hypothetical protein
MGSNSPPPPNVRPIAEIVRRLFDVRSFICAVLDFTLSWFQLVHTPGWFPATRLRYCKRRRPVSDQLQYRTEPNRVELGRNEPKWTENSLFKKKKQIGLTVFCHSVFGYNYFTFNTNKVQLRLINSMIYTGRTLLYT